MASELIHFDARMLADRSFRKFMAEFLINYAMLEFNFCSEETNVELFFSVLSAQFLSLLRSKEVPDRDLPSDQPRVHTSLKRTLRPMV